MPDIAAGKPLGPGKWSTKQIIGHLTDTERVWAYRALRFSRGDATPLPGFDQDPYVAQAGFNQRALNNLGEEFHHVRQANLLFFHSLTEEAWQRRGEAAGALVTVHALAYMMAGHVRHHLARLA